MGALISKKLSAMIILSLFPLHFEPQQPQAITFVKQDQYPTNCTCFPPNVPSSRFVLQSNKTRSHEPVFYGLPPNLPISHPGSFESRCTSSHPPFVSDNGTASHGLPFVYISKEGDFDSEQWTDEDIEFWYLVYIWTVYLLYVS